MSKLNEPQYVDRTDTHEYEETAWIRTAFGRYSIEAELSVLAVVGDETHPDIVLTLGGERQGDQPQPPTRIALPLPGGIDAFFTLLERLFARAVADGVLPALPECQRFAAPALREEWRSTSPTRG